MSSKSHDDSSNAGKYFEAESSSDKQFSDGFKPVALFVSLVVACLVVATWLWSPTRVYWDVFDEAVFRALNATIGFGPGWQRFWALANVRVSDLIPAVLLLLLFTAGIWGLRREIQVRTLSLFITLAPVLAVTPAFLHYLVRHVFEYRRASPTVVFDDTNRLSELVPDLHFKDLSHVSFPGDHAFVLAVLTLFFWYFRGGLLAWLAALIAVAFSLPRLAGGAHWATDVIVGGGAAALIATAVMYATPLYRLLLALIQPIVAWGTKLVPEWLLVPDRGKEAESRYGYFR